MYTISYYIDKFNKIPEEMWTTGSYHNGDKSCALGHCGMDYSLASDEGMQLKGVFSNLYLYKGISVVAMVNDGFHPLYHQPTPKQRILAALYDLKANKPYQKYKSCTYSSQYDLKANEAVSEAQEIANKPNQLTPA